MFVSLLIALAIAFVGLCVVVNTKEEIVKVSAAGIALISLFFSLVLAPLFLKVLIVLGPLLINKLSMTKIKVTQR